MNEGNSLIIHKNTSIVVGFCLYFKLFVSTFTTPNLEKYHF